MYATDAKGMDFRSKQLFNNSGRKELISNATNFRDIDNPFGNYSMTLMSLKKEKHEAWKVR